MEINAFKEAIIFKPDYYDASNKLGLAYKTNNHHIEKAIEGYKSSIKFK